MDEGGNYTNPMLFETVVHLLCSQSDTYGCGCFSCEVRARAEVAVLGMQDSREGCGHEAAQSAWAGSLHFQLHWCVSIGSGVGSCT